PTDAPVATPPPVAVQPPPPPTLLDRIRAVEAAIGAWQWVPSATGDTPPQLLVPWGDGAQGLWAQERGEEARTAVQSLEQRGREVARLARHGGVNPAPLLELLRDQWGDLKAIRRLLDEVRLAVEAEVERAAAERAAAAAATTPPPEPERP